MAEPHAELENRSYPPIMFVPEVDSLGRDILADGAQLRLSKNSEYSTLLVLSGKSGQSLSLIRPDETEQTVQGNSWFVYGDNETGTLYIKKTEGKFDLPKQTLMIGAGVNSTLLSFKPEDNPDYKITEERSLQPIALISKDGQGQLVISRKYFEKIDVPTNTVSFVPATFGLTHPQAQETHAAANIIAQWQKQEKEENVRRETMHQIKDLANVATLRLAHKNKKMPDEIKPHCKYNEESKTYSVDLFMSEFGKNKLISPAGTDTSTEENHQVGEDFGFGSRLIFDYDKEPNGDITGSIKINEYDGSQTRTTRTLVSDVKIKPTDNTIPVMYHSQEVLSPIYSLTFSSPHPDDIINVLVGIDRGLKPRYLPENQING